MLVNKQVVAVTTQQTASVACATRKKEHLYFRSFLLCIRVGIIVHTFVRPCERFSRAKVHLPVAGAERPSVTALKKCIALCESV